MSTETILPSRAPEPAAHQPPAGVVELTAPPELARLAAGWPAGRAMSELLASLLYGGIEPMFRALAQPDYLHAGAALHDAAGAPLGWMALVRHHERAGYAGTARLVFDLDASAPDGSLEALHRRCCAAPRARGLRVVIGFADYASPVLSRGYAVLGFRSAGEIRLGARGEGALQVHARETADAD